MELIKKHKHENKTNHDSSYWFADHIL